MVRRIDERDPSIRIIGGSVQVDRATISRNGTVTIFDDGGALLPDDVNDLLAPLIGELRLWIGVRYWDWTAAEALAGTDFEWIPIGTLVVMGVQGAGRNSYTISLLDRAQFVTSFPFNYAIPNGTPTAQALSDLLQFFVPSSHLSMNIPLSTEHTTGPLLYEEGADAGEVAHDFALAMGMRLYVDAMGTFTVGPEPTTDDPPVIELAPGADSAMMRPQRGVDATGSVNAVTFSGESAAGDPVSGFAEDSDPLSLTYRARVGYRPAPKQFSPLMRSAPQCALAAKTWLQRNLGLVDTISVPIIPNPALDSGDVIRVVDADQALDAVLVVDSLAVSLKATDGEQVLTTRARVLR